MHRDFWHRNPVAGGVPTGILEPDLGRIEEANAMIDFRPDLVSANSVASQLREDDYVQPPRDFFDLMTSRMIIYTPGWGDPPLLIQTAEGFDHRRTDSIAVVRGRIVYTWGESLIPDPSAMKQGPD